MQWVNDLIPGIAIVRLRTRNSRNGRYYTSRQVYDFIGHLSRQTRVPTYNVPGPWVKVRGHDTGITRVVSAVTVWPVDGRPPEVPS